MSGRLEELTFEKLLEIIRQDQMNTPEAREVAFVEIMRRFRNIETGLDETKKDERLSYPTATVFENAPLALVQCGLENQVRALKWVLKILDGERKAGS